MRYLAGILSILGLFGVANVYAGPGLCTKCDRIREYNKTHHKNYEYYEDYLKDEEEKKAQHQPKALQWNFPKPKSNSDDDSSPQQENSDKDVKNSLSQQPKGIEWNWSQHKRNTDKESISPSQSSSSKGKFMQRDQNSNDGDDNVDRN